MKSFAEFVEAVFREFWDKPTYTAEDGVEPQTLHSAALDVAEQLTDIDVILSMIAEVHRDPKVDVGQFSEHDGPAGDNMVEYQQIVLATAAQVRLMADGDAQAITAEEGQRYDAARARARG